MTEKTDQLIDDSAKVLIQNYAPQPIALSHGKGVELWDVDGKRYIDCSIGYAVASLGHAHPAMLKTINEQAGRLMICQASFATQEKLDCANLLIDNSCFDLAFFSNSGTESVEAALKLARKWAYESKSETCNEIISFKKSFHGRSYGAASVTEKCLSQPFFAPYIGGVHFAEFNNVDSVKQLISDKTAAIILEPVQGEGGLIPANKEFLQGVRDLCDEHNIALIYDEVQVGMGRLGTFFAYEHFNVEPDIIALAKGMGGGFPVGAMLARQRFGEHMGPGSHGTTYGGNPLATAVVHTVTSEILKPGFLDHVNKISAQFFDGLKEIQRSSNKITDIRGIGLMIGIETTLNPQELILNLQKNGLMVTQAGSDTVRITPALIMSEAEADEVLEILSKTLQEE